MATRVVDENEIILNGVHYRVSNPVRRFITSQFPGKITLGDYNLESNPITSTFVSSDHRGGIGIERMDPSKDLDRVWWSTGQLRHKDHFVLPKLAVASGSDPDTTLEQFLTFKGVLYAAGGGFLHTYNPNNTWTTIEVSTTTSINNASDAEVITGGGYNKEIGYFIEPTTILTTNPHFKTMEEEIFGQYLLY